MPSALIILAQGAEEMETVISADVLTRGGVGFLLPKSVQAVFLVLRDHDLDLLLRSEEEQSLLVDRVVGEPHFWGANVLAGVWCLCITLIKQWYFKIYIYIIIIANYFMTDSGFICRLM